jgi:hypothetical protein
LQDSLLEFCPKTIALGTHLGLRRTVGEYGPQAVDDNFAPEILMMSSFDIESSPGSVLSTIRESNELGFFLAETKRVEEFSRK